MVANTLETARPKLFYAYSSYTLLHYRRDVYNNQAN